MLDSAVFALALAAGPDLPSIIDKGPKPYAGASLHRGVKYSPRHDKIRRCIRARESDNEYRAVSASGTYRGAYQFSPALKRGAAWMIQKQLRGSHGKEIALEIGRTLRRVPMNQWSIYWQDRAFWTIWDMGAGKKHWNATVAGTECW